MKKYIFIGLAALCLLPACAMLSAPKAFIEVDELTFTAKNADKNAWEDCTFIVNAKKGEDNQYAFEAGDIPGMGEQTVLLPRFSQADGRRFIPLMTKATDAKIQCKSPALPYTQDL